MYRNPSLATDRSQLQKAHSSIGISMHRPAVRLERISLGCATLALGDRTLHVGRARGG